MAEIIPRVDDPELFFGIVAPIGTKLEGCISALENKLQEFGYFPVTIRVTDVFPVLHRKPKIPCELRFKPYEERYLTHIKFGNSLREYFNDFSFLASATVQEITERRTEIVAREKLGDARKIAYILRQFKRKDEIDLLRSVYGKLFFQLSVYSRRSSRVDNLARKIASSHNSADPNRFREQAEHLVRIDENEVEERYGQRVSDVFHEADFIANTDLNEHPVEDQISRFVDLIFGSNSTSPTKSEYGMYVAKSASLRTLDLSRQVGAAIFSEMGEIISLGANEVPKAGGGTYWSDDEFDDRDYRRGEDSNQKRKRELLSELIPLIHPDGDASHIMKDPNVRSSQFMDAIEYGRIVHAEMSAICDAARLGRPLKGAKLYCTTFPCHVCAKHIVAAGVSEVIFLEPYPKSLANELHGDSVDIDGQSRGEYSSFPSTPFKHFFGVSPRRYRDLFERQRRKDNETGKFEAWRGGKRQVIFDIKVPIYLQLELHLLKVGLSPLMKKAGVPISALRMLPNRSEETTTQTVSGRQRGKLKSVRTSQSG